MKSDRDAGDGLSTLSACHVTVIRKRQALIWKPGGKMEKGAAAKDGVASGRQETEYNLGKLERLAHDRDAWQHHDGSPCSRRGDDID